jgi:hypothetical protein
MKITVVRSIVLASSVLASAASCKSEQARDTERAAELTRAKTADLTEEQRELAASVRESAKDVVDEVGDVAYVSAEVERAKADFERKKLARVSHLEGQVAVLSTVPELLDAAARGASLAANDRAKLDAKLQTLKVRIDEAQQVLAKLPSTTAAEWTSRDDEITRALRSIDDARDEAVELLEDSVDDDRPGS